MQPWAPANAYGFLDLSEEVLDQVAPFVGLPVKLCREAAVGFGWNDGLYFCRSQRLADPVGIERPVGKELAARQSLNQSRRAAQVVGLSGQQAEVDQVAERIGQGHDLAGHAAARAPDGLALSPPFAPCPWRWTLVMVPSIMAYSKSASSANALNIR